MSEPLSFMNSWGQREWGESGKICNRPWWRLWAEWPGASKYNIDHRSSVFRSELQRSKNTFVNLQMEMESLMTMTQSCWCLLQSPPQLGYQDCEKVWSREASISKIARSPISVIYDWETLMFITIINVDCLKCLKTQFATHGRCATSNGSKFIISIIFLGPSRFVVWCRDCPELVCWGDSINWQASILNLG